MIEQMKDLSDSEVLDRLYHQEIFVKEIKAAGFSINTTLAEEEKVLNDLLNEAERRYIESKQP